MTGHTTTFSPSISQRIAAGIMLSALGAVMLFAVGLSGMAVAHNTAHDTRHAIGFPCH